MGQGMLLVLLLAVACVDVLAARSADSSSQRLFRRQQLSATSGSRSRGVCNRYTGCTALNTYPLPCYDYVLTILFDGEFGWLYDKRNFMNHQSAAGRSRRSAIAKGRETAEWIKAEYGIDFTHLDDSAFLESDPDNFHVLTNADGVPLVSFYNYLLNPSGRYRLATASKGDQAAFFNSFVSNGGWGIKVLTDFTTSTNIQLQAGAQISRGDYVIGACRDNPIFGDLVTEEEPLSIAYTCKSFVPPASTVIIDCTVEHDKLGTGNARGALFPRENVGDKKVYDGRNVLTFPADQAI